MTKTYTICNIRDTNDPVKIIFKLQELIGPKLSVVLEEHMAKCMHTLLIIEEGDKHIATHALPDLLKIDTVEKLFKQRDVIKEAVDTHAKAIADDLDGQIMTQLRAEQEDPYWDFDMAQHRARYS